MNPNIFWNRFRSRRFLLLFTIVILVAIIAGVFFWLNRNSISLKADSTANWRSGNDAVAAGVIARPETVIGVTVRSYQESEDSAPVLSIDKIKKTKKGYASISNSSENGNKYSLELVAGNSVLDKIDFTLSHFTFGPVPVENDPLAEPYFEKEAVNAFNFSLRDDATSVRITDQTGSILDSQEIRGIPVTNNEPNFHTIKGNELQGQKQQSAALSNKMADSAMAATTDGQYLDITFIGDDYTDTTSFHNDVNRMASYLVNTHYSVNQVPGGPYDLSIEPFKSRASQIRFHYIDSTADLGCHFDTNITRLVLCDNTTVWQQVNNSGVPYDTVAVLLNSTAYGGGGGSYAAFTSSHVQSEDIFVHEFGHSFGKLADEYLYSSSPYNGTYPSDLFLANCYAGSSVPYAGWNGLVAQLDYTPGCSYPNFYRSSYQSVMINHYYPFNPVSQVQLNSQMDIYAGAFNDSVSPIASILSPTNNMNVAGTIKVTSSESDNNGVAWSELWIDGTFYRTTFMSPFSFSWSTEGFSNGQHSLKVISYDTKRNRGESAAVIVNVNNNSSDSIKPTVSVTLTNTYLISGIISVPLSASDNVGVSKVILFDNGRQVGSDSTSPYVINWDTAGLYPGYHALSAIAYDAAGNEGSTAFILSTTVKASSASPSDPTPPTVLITSPSGGALLASRSIVTISANASDNIGVTKVSFLANNKLICSDTTAPYTCLWKAAVSGKNRTVTLKTVATDAAGNIGSSSVVITIK